MARSKYVWLIVFENGHTQFIKAQTISQIMYCNHLVKDSDSIINITRMQIDDGLYDVYEAYNEAIDYNPKNTCMNCGHSFSTKSNQLVCVLNENKHRVVGDFDNCNDYN